MIFTSIRNSIYPKQLLHQNSNSSAVVDCNNYPFFWLLDLILSQEGSNFVLRLEDRPSKSPTTLFSRLHPWKKVDLKVSLAPSLSFPILETPDSASALAHTYPDENSYRKCNFLETLPRTGQQARPRTYNKCRVGYLNPHGKQSFWRGN